MLCTIACQYLLQSFKTFASSPSNIPTALGALQILNAIPTEAVDNQCTPNAFVTVLFFVSFELLCAYIILNIVVAIILEGMINDEADEMLPVPPSMTQQYTAVRACV